MKKNKRNDCIGWMELLEISKYSVGKKHINAHQIHWSMVIDWKLIGPLEYNTQ